MFVTSGRHLSPTSARLCGSSGLHRFWFRFCLCVSTLVLCLPIAAAAQAPPSRLTDRDFWQIVTSTSEPGGRFLYDNIISNELSVQQVIPDLQQSRRPGAYIGVGPEQNLTYIAAIRPTIAFVVDIRRDNMLLHLMYKALIELSKDRLEFLSQLFARVPPDGITSGAAVEELLDRFASLAVSPSLVETNFDAVITRLTRVHRFALTADDRLRIKSIYALIARGGPDLRGDYGLLESPSYRELMTGSDPSGRQQSYLASEEQFAALREYESNNLIVPIVGDFAGPKALATVGQYLAKRHLVVTTFYISNVEAYLFRGAGWKAFYETLSALPIDQRSVVVRTLFLPPTEQYRTKTVLDSIGQLSNAFLNGDILSIQDIVMRSGGAR